jgi:limonene-1,2-epoxide hydrolase
VTLPFRAAVEARDIDAMAQALSPDVKFHSPMAHTPFEGRDAVRKLFEALFATFEDFHYTDELAAGDGTHALVFRAHVGDRQLQGVDLMRVGEDGLIHEFTVMIRPASGLMALGAAMAPHVETLK